MAWVGGRRQYQGGNLQLSVLENNAMCRKQLTAIGELESYDDIVFYWYGTIARALAKIEYCYLLSSSADTSAEWCEEIASR